jgi:amino acid adenylation domain-containing protein
MKTDSFADIYELTPLQQGLLFHTVAAPNSGVYVNQLRALLHGPLEVEVFRHAWQEVVRRHAVLRTSFFWEELDKPLQVVHREAELPFQQYDWRGQTDAQKEQRLAMWLQMDRRRGFKLERPPLSRLVFIRVSDDDAWFVWTYHHLLFDGWSLPLILREVFVFYEALRKGQSISLPQTRPFAAYVQWLQSRAAGPSREFWRRTLAGFAAPTMLGIEQSVRGASAARPSFHERQVRLTRESTDRLEALARKHRLTLNTVVQGAWALLLGQYSGDPEVVFGVTMSGRTAPLQGIESMVGLFVNTLPVRVALPPNERLVPWLQSLQSQWTELRQHEHCPLEEVQRASDLPPATPLFETLYVFENYPLDSSLVRTCGEELEIQEIHDEEQSNYPLNLIVCPGEKLLLRLIYDAGRFEDEAIERLAGHVENLLSELVANTHKRLSEMSCLSETERHRVLVEWNGHAAEYRKDVCAHQLFAEQARQTPDGVALVFGNQELTYRQLDERSNQLAHYLQKLGVRPETRVGVAIPRCPEMVVILLGVLKAGGAYVPLDPDYPPNRLGFMLEDSQAQVLVCQESLLDRFPKQPGQVVCLDAGQRTIAQQASTPASSSVGPNNLAYVIYTSGSTGRPKGVAVEHRSLSHLCQEFPKHVGVEAGDRVLQFASLSFDASVVEIFPPLSLGAAVVLAPAELLLPGPELIDLLRNHRVTTAILPPSALAVLPVSELPDLELLIAAGERCTAGVVQRWLPGRRFVNGYGPTEATVCTSTFECRRSDEHPPIGRPIANVKAYVLGPHREPVPVGVAGELYIGGSGLAREYLNRPELTAERFVRNPFSRTSGSRLYRTGDRCRWLPHGNLQFLGRVDHQVKVRGFRIELGEIEAALVEHADVGQAAVTAREDAAGDTRLVAYVVPRGEATPTVGLLQDFLRDRLPRFMVPATIVLLDSLPLSPNGKVDRKALPAPDSARPDLENPYVPPRTPEERILAGIWTEVLGVDKVGVHDDFFQLGGASIKSLRIVAKAREAGLAPASGSLTPQMLFEYTTIAQLAALLRLAEAPPPTADSGIGEPTDREADHVNSPEGAQR